MDNTAYTENLNRIAEKMAKDALIEPKQEDINASINYFLPLAAIAIEEMADAYRIGYRNGRTDGDKYNGIRIIGCEEYIATSGLKPDTPTKTDSNG